MSSEIKKEVECPICLEVFKTPIRILSCGHMFCHHCLERHVSSLQAYRCPSCRQEVDPRIPVENLPRAYLVENMIKQIDQIKVVKVLSGDAMEQLKDLAISYEQKRQFHEAVNTWRTILENCVPINKILPLFSMINCWFNMGKFNEALIFTEKLVTLLQSTADHIEAIKAKCDDQICNLVEKFFVFKKYKVIFQLLQCRFNLLKRHYNGEALLIKLVNISVLMGDVAKVIRNDDDIELFKKQYQFLDTILLLIKNSPTTNMTHEFKCGKIGSFLHNYGCCCNEVKDSVKAIGLHNQAIASKQIAFGDKSSNYKILATCYNNLGLALEYTSHLSEAKTAYQTSIKIKKQARDYENEEERNQSILITACNLRRLEEKLN